MRGVELNVRYITRDEFNEIARERNQIQSNPAGNYVAYTKILDELFIDSDTHLQEIYGDELSDLLFTIPGVSMPEREVKLAAHEGDLKKTLFSKVFATAMQRGKLIVDYKPRQRGEFGDDFTFRSRDGGLVLTRFSLRVVNAGFYFLNPQIPNGQARYRRLLGILDS